MQKLIRFLFGVADVVLALLLLSGAVSLLRMFFAFLDRTIPGGSDQSKQAVDGVLAMMGLPSLTALSVVLLVLAVFFTLGYMLSYFLLLRKQVLGLFTMIGIDLLGVLFWQFDPAIAIFTGLRWLILGLPWLLTWIDLRRRGALGSG